MSKKREISRKKKRSRKIKNLVSHIWNFSARYIIGVGEDLRDWESLTTRKKDRREEKQSL